MAIIHEQMYGPFKTGTVLILVELGKGKFTLEWMSARKLKQSHIKNKNATVFKFKPLKLISVSIHTCLNDELSVYVAQHSTIGQLRITSGGKPKTARVLATVCADPDCAPTSMVCPPGKPYPKCVNGTLTCVAGERPTVGKS